MKISLLATFLYSISTASASFIIPSAQEIAEGYLRRVADEVLSEIKIMKFRERVDKIKNVINTVVESVLSDHRPHYELNQIAHCLHRFRNFDNDHANFLDRFRYFDDDHPENDLWICVGLEIHVLPGALQEMLDVFTAKLILFARKVGMSPNDFKDARRDSRIQNLVNSMDPVPENLYDLLMPSRSSLSVLERLTDPQKLELLVKVESVNSDAKVVISRLRNLILVYFNLSLQSREIIAAIVDVSVGILRAGPPSLARLAFFIDWVAQSLRETEDYGSMLLKTAFLLSKHFGVRFLLLYPKVIPLGWSKRKVLAIRTIIGCIIHFNQYTIHLNQYTRDGSRFPWSLLASVTDNGTIEKVASVVSLMNERLLMSWEDARLFSPGVFLSEFLLPTGPSPYARVAVHSLLVPPLLFRKVLYKLDDFPRRIEEFLQYYPRYENVYVHLASRANSILANFRGKIPLALADFLRGLPASLLQNEVNQKDPQSRNKLENIVDEFVLPVFGLIEEGLERHDSFLHPDVHLQLKSFFQDVLSRLRLTNVSGYHPVAPLREKLQTLTSRIHNL